MNKQFIEFLDNLATLSQDRVYKWKTSFDRVTLNDDFDLTIDKLFNENIGEYGDYVYYITYDDNSIKFHIPIYPSQEGYSVISRLFDAASLSSWTSPKLRDH